MRIIFQHLFSLEEADKERAFDLIKAAYIAKKGAGLDTAELEKILTENDISLETEEK